MHVHVCPHLYILLPSPPTCTPIPIPPQPTLSYTPSPTHPPHTPTCPPLHTFPYTPTRPPLHTFPYTPLHILPYTPSPTHPPLCTPPPLLPCSNMLEVQQWITALNRAAAMYSNAPLASAVGSQNKFVRR